MSFVKVPNKRLLLTEDDFTTLVSGNILVKEGVEIALQDIGFSRMKTIIDNQDGGGSLNIDQLQRITEMLQSSPSRPFSETLGNPVQSFDSLGGDDLEDLLPF